MSGLCPRDSWAGKETQAMPAKKRKRNEDKNKDVQLPHRPTHADRETGECLAVGRLSCELMQFQEETTVQEKCGSRVHLSLPKCSYRGRREGESMFGNWSSAAPSFCVEAAASVRAYVKASGSVSSSSNSTSRRCTACDCDCTASGASASISQRTREEVSQEHSLSMPCSPPSLLAFSCCCC